MSKKNTFDHHFGRTGIIRFKEQLFVFIKEMKAALEKRLQQHVLLECEVDPSLLGGAIVRTNDNVVIDGSVRGQLNRLLNLLSV